MFNVIEFAPLLAGSLLSVLVAVRSGPRETPWALTIAFIAVGTICSRVAGEWAEGITLALPAMLWDSAKVAFGYALAHFAVRRPDNRVA
jgi:hypothetical protein